MIGKVRLNWIKQIVAIAGFLYSLFLELYLNHYQLCNYNLVQFENC